MRNKIKMMAVLFENVVGANYNKMLISLNNEAATRTTARAEGTTYPTITLR